MHRRILAVLLCLTLATGCEKRADMRSTMFDEDDSEFVIAVLIDLSESFEPRMAEGGQAYAFLMKLLDRYFRQRIGTDDQLILAQITGSSDRALLWQGSPTELRKQFPDPSTFSAFLKSKANARGSCVHDSIVQTVEYMTNEPSVASGRATSALFVLSDMIDSDGNEVASRARAIDAIRRLSDVGGTFGFYFVDQTMLMSWKRELQKAGVGFALTPDFRQPSLPNFD